MARDSSATRARILAAAVEEFAAHGLAGGRVDRVASASGANPKSIYDYFGSKAGLFDAAVTEVLAGIGRRAPLTPEDLPGYAGRLFDEILEHPEAVRLNRWRQLERPDAGPDDTELYAAALRHIHADTVGEGSGIDPADALILVLSLPQSWVDISRDARRAAGAEGADEDRVARFRAALVEAVTRILD